jgi:hypothetical protein
MEVKTVMISELKREKFDRGLNAFDLKFLLYH